MITIGLGVGHSHGPARAPQPPATVVAIVERGEPNDIGRLLGSLNDLRASKGLAPLALDSRLSEIARAHGMDMARRRYFDHTSPEGLTPFDRLDRAHYRYGYAGENLAVDRDVDAAHRALAGSPEHRRNMLEPHYAHVGIAAVDSREGKLVVEDFSD